MIINRDEKIEDLQNQLENIKNELEELKGEEVEAKLKPIEFIYSIDDTTMYNGMSRVGSTSLLPIDFDNIEIIKKGGSSEYDIMTAWDDGHEGDKCTYLGFYNDGEKE